MTKLTIKKAVLSGRQFLSSNKHNALHFTIKHTGKMTGLWSLSTSCLDNPICKARAKVKGSICAHCFAMLQISRWSDMRPCLKKNLETLSNSLLDKDIPIINPPSGLFRFESFGDTLNYKQALNYIRIALLNPWTKFAAWTKNTEHYLQAFTFIDKPKNLMLIKSSKQVNVIEELTEDEKKYFDKVFTVFDKDFAKENNIKINCGARSCATCRNCYENKKSVYVNEILK